MIHQSKSRYYLGPSQTSKVEFFSKNLQHKCLNGSIRYFQKHFLFFVSECFASWKKARNIYTRMLEFAFPREDVVD